MKYRAKSVSLHPIHLLRYLMFLNWTGFLKGPGVLESTWEIEALFTAVLVRNSDGKQVEIPVFPEFDDKVPFRVSGRRLVEGMSLLIDIEETVFTRLSDNPPAVDLRIVADTGYLLVETDDEELFQAVQVYFTRTSDVEFIPGSRFEEAAELMADVPEERQGRIFF